MRKSVGQTRGISLKRHPMCPRPPSEAPPILPAHRLRFWRWIIPRPRRVRAIGRTELFTSLASSRCRDQAATVSHEKEIDARRRRFVHCNPAPAKMSRVRQANEVDGIPPNPRNRMPDRRNVLRCLLSPLQACAGITSRRKPRNRARRFAPRNPARLEPVRRCRTCGAPFRPI